jgi:hypothetical protein
MTVPLCHRYEQQQQGDFIRIDHALLRSVKCTPGQR